MRQIQKRTPIRREFHHGVGVLAVFVVNGLRLAVRGGDRFLGELSVGIVGITNGIDQLLARDDLAVQGRVALVGECDLTFLVCIIILLFSQGCQGRKTPDTEVSGGTKTSC